MKLLRKLRAVFRKEKLDAEMSEEMRAHLELQVEENIARGMSPEEARYAALRAFGGVEQIKEQVRDQRAWVWLEQLAQDFRFAARGLRKSPGFAVVAVLSLALGVGANTAIFSALDRMLLRSLPVENPDELIRFRWLSGSKGGRPFSTEDEMDRIDPASGRRTGTVFSLATFEALRAHHPFLKEVFAFTRPPGFMVEIEGELSADSGQVVSGGYYTGLGAKAWLGRTILPQDDQPGAAPVAVISHRCWERNFGGDVAVLGKTIRVNRSPLVIVGVMPPDFVDPISVFGQPSFSFPLGMLPLLDPSVARKSQPGYWWVRIMGRLQPGATQEQATASLQAAFESSTRDGLTEKDDRPLLLATAGGQGLSEDRRANANPLLVLTGMAALVLLAACANVANLLLARGAMRRREFAMRLALGAGRGRLIRQLLAESALLAFLGAAFGLLLARWGGALMPFVGARGSDVVDLRIFGFASAVAALTGVGFGLVPALRATRLDLTAEFQGGARQLGGGRTRLNQTLLVVQVALSLVLLVGAGLFLRTLRNLRTVDIGFDRTRLLLFSIDAATAGYPREKFPEIHRLMAERIGGVPGVRTVSYSQTPVLGGSAGYYGRIDIPGRPPRPGPADASALNRVGPNFFATLDIPIVLGRDFDRRDETSALKAAVVNQALANRHFPGENPLGRRIRIGGGELEIVGVARDVKQVNLRTPTPPTAYIPFAQEASSAAHYAVRVTGEPAAFTAAIRNAVKEVERNLPLNRVRTQEQQIAGEMARERAFAQLSGFFGLLAVALVCIGLYGLMSYSVVRRTGEIGLRMALGALPTNVLRLFLRESLWLVLCGVGVGLGAAVAATRLIASMLFGVSPFDPLTYAGVAGLLLVVALLACLLPARRAAKVDPMVALRAE